MKIKRSPIFKAIVLLLCFVTLLTACNNSSQGSGTTTTTVGEDPVPTGPAEYKVNVVDHEGTPIKDVIVTVLQNGEAKGMKVAQNGSVTFTLERGDYTVEVSYAATGMSCYFDKEKAKFTAEITEITVALYSMPTHSQTIYAYSEDIGDHKAFEAFSITEGGYYVQCNAGRTYFLYAPQRGGTFHVEYVSELDLELGYFGGTFNVLMENQAEREGEKIILDVKNSMVGGVWVIGIDAPSACGAVIRITRVGDPSHTIHDEPWIPYTEKNFIDYYGECENKTDSGFEFIDVTDKNLTVVLNKNDGYYHLNSADGPIVYVALGTDSKYISSIKTICENQRMGAYIYDDQGNFVRKESYNELFEQYSYGTVPLTEKLAYAIKSHGDYNKWWDMTSVQHIFGEDYAKVNVNNAWLFCCGTIGAAQINDKGSQSNPISLPKLSVDNEEISAKLYMEGNKTYYFELTAVSGRKLVIERVNSNITVTYNGQEYKANSGKLEITLTSAAKEFTVTSDGEDYISLVCEIISNG